MKFRVANQNNIILIYMYMKRRRKKFYINWYIVTYIVTIEVVSDYVFRTCKRRVTFDIKSDSYRNTSSIIRRMDDCNMIGLNVT